MTVTSSLVWKWWLWEKSVFMYHYFVGLSRIQWRQAWECASVAYRGWERGVLCM